MFQYSSDIIRNLTAAVLSYIDFLVGETVPTCSVKVTQAETMGTLISAEGSECTQSCLQCRAANSNIDGYKVASYNLRTTVKEAKRKFTGKIKIQFEQADPRHLWHSIPYKLL